MAAILATALFCSLFGPLPQAHAQAIITTVNGDPITDLDVAQRIKLLRVLHQPATREAALNSLVDDLLMVQETRQYGMKPSDSEIGQEIVQAANRIKIAPELLVAQIQHAGVSDTHYKQHFAAILMFDSLIQAFHKGVEPSEAEIRADLAKEGNKIANTQYRVHQVIFVIPTAAGMAGIKGRMEAAQQLRVRFTDCNSGLQLARAMDNVAVKEEIVRNSAQLNAPLKKLLDSTPVGHLTAPHRTQEGIEMIAVCAKTASNDDSALRAAISARILAAQIDVAAQKRLKELRANAIIVKK
ncbi:MAG: SurA N-terminal domain-containing protein [Methylovirgula sp.]